MTNRGYGMRAEALGMALGHALRPQEGQRVDRLRPAWKVNVATNRRIACPPAEANLPFGSDFSYALRPILTVRMIFQRRT